MKSKEKILMLIDQNEFKNTIEMAKRLKKRYDIIFFITDLASSYDNQLLTEKSINNSFIKPTVYSLREQLIKLNLTNNFKNIDFNFLNKFEKEISSNSIIKNFLKDILLNNLYGARKVVYHPSNKDIYYKFCENISKKIIDIFSSNKIKFVYSPNTSNFVRNLILDYCKFKKIQFFWVTFRILNKLVLVDLSKKNNHYFADKLNSDKKYFNILRKQLLKKSRKVENNNLQDFKIFVKKFLKKIYLYTKIFKNDYLGLKKQRINKSHSNFFYTKSTLGSMLYWIKKDFNSYYVQKYCQKNHKLKLNKIKKNKYIFYPLHVTPEAGVYDQSELYDQIYLIQRIAKNLPIDTYLVVKPHPANFTSNGECEDLNWYKEIDNIFNVILISHNVNSLYLIKNSIGVVSVSGSASLEANLMEKPSFLFGSTEFSNLYGIYKFNDNFFQNINKFDKKKLRENFKFFNYFNTKSFELKNYNNFLAPDDKFLKTKKCKNLFDFFAKQILNNVKKI